MLHIMKSVCPRRHAVPFIRGEGFLFEESDKEMKKYAECLVCLSFLNGLIISDEST